MHYDSIEILLKNSPTLRILRSPHATLMITFLYNQFKINNDIALTNSLLVQKLAEYLEDLNYRESAENIEENTDTIEVAKRLIEKWTEENYLRNYIDESAKVVMNVLTKHTERVFLIVELLKDKALVGTESKFKDIFYKLKELIDNTTEDPKKKIEELQKRKKEIDNEIRKIKQEGAVPIYENYQVQTRFSEVVKLANELMGDFKEVEDNFKDIVRDIYEKQSNKVHSKGKILQYTFDSLNTLKDSDQGKSFYAFWKFLIDDISQEELKYLVAEVYKILDDRGLEYNDRFLRKMKSMLHAAATKVLDTNNLLADKLSRIIAEKDILDRKQARETINEIRNLALQLVDKTPSLDFYIEIEGDAYIDLPMERKLGEEQLISIFDEQPIAAENIIDIDALGKVANPNSINKKQLLHNVERLLNEKSPIVLSEVIAEYPISKGLAELLGYISLAQNHNKFLIHLEKTEYLLFDAEKGKYLKAPEVVYHK